MFLTGCLLKDETPRDETPDVKVTCVFPDEANLEKLKSGVVVKKRSDNQYLFLGDILLSNKDVKLLDETGSILTEEDINYNPKNQKLTNIPISPETGMLQYSPTTPRFWTMLRYKFAENITPSQKKQY